MKYLIVNGDDFGASNGINRGIIEAHRRGILTSASLMVNTSWSEEASRLCRLEPALSVGLHVQLPGGGPNSIGRLVGNCETQLESQLSRFNDLVGQLPSHLDSHYNSHRDPRFLPVFLGFARRYKLPLREYSGVRYYAKFYGRWKGEQGWDGIGVKDLVYVLENKIGDGITELGCHPGYADPELRSSYLLQREVELQTLCTPELHRVLAEQEIELVSFRDLEKAWLSSSEGLS